MNTQPFSQTGQGIELCCEYLSVRFIWLYIIIMSRTSFRVYPHSIVFLNIKELLAQSRREIWILSDCSWTRTNNHLVRKGRLNYLAKVAKWLSCVVSTSKEFYDIEANYRVWIHSETRTWHDNSIQSNTPYR